MGSWDGFIVPMPFSRGVFVYGEPIEVPAGADAAGLESARLLLEERLAEATRRAETIASGRPTAEASGARHV
jgi:lysophospholipid acyltransferase (LPLAT)-like uncharacterized protein